MDGTHRPFKRSNRTPASTRSRWSTGEKIKAGQVLADGPATER
jgi:hypothetical protein